MKETFFPKLENWITSLNSPYRATYRPPAELELAAIEWLNGQVTKNMPIIFLRTAISLIMGDFCFQGIITKHWQIDIKKYCNRCNLHIVFCVPGHLPVFQLCVNSNELPDKALYKLRY